MRVYSAFDGMSCGQIALNRANIEYNRYFACELEKYPIQVTQANYPNTIQLGDVNNINVSRATVYRTIDVLVKNNLVRKMELGDGRALYEHKADDEHHDHIICLETGKIIEFYNEELEKLQDEIVKKHGYKLVRHVHQLFVKPLKK